MQSKIISLNDFINKSEWKITKVERAISITPTIDQFCCFMFDNIDKDKEILVSTILQNKDKEIISHQNIIIGFYMFIKYSDEFLNLFNVYKKTIESNITDPVFLENIKNMENKSLPNYVDLAIIVKNYFDRLKNKSIDNINSKIVTLFTKNAKLNIIENENVDLFVEEVVLTKDTFMPYDTVAELTKSKIFSLIESKLLSKKYSEMSEIYNKDIILPFSHLGFGQDWIDSLDNYFYFYMQISDLGFLGMHGIKANYINWKNIINMRFLQCLEEQGIFSITTMDEFKSVISKIVLRLALLRELGNNLPTINFSDKVKFLYLQLRKHFIPVELIAQIIEKDCEFENNKIVYKSNISSEKKLEDMYKVMINLRLSMDIINPADLQKFVTISLSKMRVFTDAKNFIKFIKQSMKENLNKDAPNKDSLLETIETFDSQKTVESLMSPMPAQSPKVLIIAEVLAYYELLEFNHKIEDINFGVPFFISKQLLINEKSMTVPFFNLGDLIFLNTDSADDVRQSAMNRKNIDFNNLYFKNCESFNYLMNDAEIRNMCNTKTWTEENIQARGEKYLDIFKKLLVL